MAFRKQYVKELRIIGHFNKMTLEENHDAVEAELKRLMPLMPLMPLMRHGGFMMMPDHLITPGVALDDYRWFLDRWGQIRL